MAPTIHHNLQKLEDVADLCLPRTPIHFLTGENLGLPHRQQYAEAYHDGRITLREFMEQLEWCWDMKFVGGPEHPLWKGRVVLLLRFWRNMDRSQGTFDTL
jgi:hypothetical protein